jgi:hypothetical protein
VWGKNRLDSDHALVGLWRSAQHVACDGGRGRSGVIYKRTRQNSEKKGTALLDTHVHVCRGLERRTRCSLRDRELGAAFTQLHVQVGQSCNMGSYE